MTPVRLADMIGVATAAERLGVPHATMDNWAKRRRKVPGPAYTGQMKVRIRQSADKLEAENARLRRELASVKLDNEILRKAAAYFFARESS